MPANEKIKTIVPTNFEWLTFHSQMKKMPMIALTRGPSQHFPIGTEWRLRVFNQDFCHIRSKKEQMFKVDSNKETTIEILLHIYVGYLRISGGGSICINDLIIWIIKDHGFF